MGDRRREHHLVILSPPWPLRECLVLIFAVLTISDAIAGQRRELERVAAVRASGRPTKCAGYWRNILDCRCGHRHGRWSHWWQCAGHALCCTIAELRAKPLDQQRIVDRTARAWVVLINRFAERWRLREPHVDADRIGDKRTKTRLQLGQEFARLTDARVKHRRDDQADAVAI